MERGKVGGLGKEGGWVERVGGEDLHTNSSGVSTIECVVDRWVYRVQTKVGGG